MGSHDNASVGIIERKSRLFDPTYLQLHFMLMRSLHHYSTHKPPSP